MDGIAASLHLPDGHHLAMGGLALAVAFAFLVWLHRREDALHPSVPRPSKPAPDGAVDAVSEEDKARGYFSSVTAFVPRKRRPSFDIEIQKRGVIRGKRVEPPAAETPAVPSPGFTLVSFTASPLDDERTLPSAPDASEPKGAA